VPTHELLNYIFKKGSWGHNFQCLGALELVLAQLAWRQLDRFTPPLSSPCVQAFDGFRDKQRALLEHFERAQTQR